MTDRSFDFELIMAIAEGTIPPEEAATAERGLNAEGRAELDMQRIAIAALSEASAPALQQAERLALRDAVRTAINLDTAPKTNIVPTRRSPWYARLLPALTALGLVIAIVAIGVTSNLGSPDFTQGASTDTAESAEAQVDEALDGGASIASDPDAARAPTGQLAGIDAESDIEDGGFEQSEQAAVDAQPAVTIAAASEPSRPQIPDLGIIDSADLEQLQAAVEDARLSSADSFDYRSGFDEIGSSIAVLCLQVLTDSLDQDAVVVLVATATIDGRPGEVFVIEDADTATALLYWIDQCTLVTSLDLNP